MSKKVIIYLCVSLMFPVCAYSDEYLDSQFFCYTDDNIRNIMWQGFTAVIPFPAGFVLSLIPLPPTPGSKIPNSPGVGTWPVSPIRGGWAPQPWHGTYENAAEQHMNILEEIQQSYSLQSNNPYVNSLRNNPTSSQQSGTNQVQRTSLPQTMPNPHQSHGSAGTGTIVSSPNPLSGSTPVKPDVGGIWLGNPGRYEVDPSLDVDDESLIDLTQLPQF